MSHDYTMLTKEQNRLLDQAEQTKTGLTTSNNEYMVYHSGAKNTHRLHAETDAVKNLPDNTNIVATVNIDGAVTTITDREQQIVAEYENKYHDLTDNASATLDALKSFNDEYRDYHINPAVKRAEKETASAILHSSDMAAENMRHAKEIADLTREKSRIDTTFQTAQKRFEPHVQQHGRDYTNGSVPFIRHWFWHVVTVMILGIMEIPFHKVVFDHIVSSTIEAYVYATATGVFMIWGAHMAGKFYKQHSEKGKLAFAIIISGVLLVICWGIGVFRYLEVHNIPFKNIDHVTVKQLVKDFSFWFFFTLSLLVALVGMTIAFFTHDSSSTFERAFKEHDAAEQRYDADMAAWNAKHEAEEDVHNAHIARIDGAHNQRLGRIPGELRQGKDIYLDYMAIYNSIARLLNDLEDAMIKGANETAAIYRSHNMQRRADKTTAPEVWRTTYHLQFNGEDIARKYPLIS